jgi:hypothetical protein
MPFGAGATVQWNGAPLVTTALSGAQLSAVVPASFVSAPCTAAVTVLMGDAVSSPATFTIDAALAIDELSPFSAGAGGDAFTLTVDGVGFGTDAVVNWKDAPLVTNVTSVMEVSAQVPAALVAEAGTASVTVVSGGATSNAVSFTVVGEAPFIDVIEPNVQSAGAGGFTLTVTGTGFTTDSVVMWNGTPLMTTVVSDEQVSASVPASLIAGTGATITVVAGGAASNAVNLTISPNPTIGGLRPGVALTGGTQFTLIVDGVNFSRDAVVQWGTKPLATTFDDAKQLTATVPASLLNAAGAISVTVLTGGSTSNAMPFTVIIPQPVIGLLEPATVVAGSPRFTLTVTGGFGAGDFALQVVRAPERQSFIPQMG